jgi:hypothetical protein
MAVTVQKHIHRRMNVTKSLQVKPRVIFCRAMDARLETRYRLLGVLPLLFFAVQTIHYWRFGGMGNLLWMCNAGNVLLGIGC